MTDIVADKPVLPERVNSLVLPLADMELLVPVTAIAEVVAGNYPREPGEQETSWCYGWITWRDQHIPLISFEAMMDHPRPEPQNHSRIAVFNAVGDFASTGFFAMLLSDYPSPLAITEENALTPITDEGPASGLLMMGNIAGRDLSVPDLALVERLCADIAA
jgi:chemosensory pili system protein ChpC